MGELLGSPSPSLGGIARAAAVLGVVPLLNPCLDVRSLVDHAAAQLERLGPATARSVELQRCRRYGVLSRHLPFEQNLGHLYILLVVDLSTLETILTVLVLPTPQHAVYRDCVAAPQLSTLLNQRIGENLQRFRKASGMSQADLAAELTRRGLPFQQQTILKIEKGARPLRGDELAIVAELVGVDVRVILEYSDAEEVAAATAQLESALAGIAERQRQIAERQRQIAELEVEIKRYDLLKREAEDRLAKVSGADGGH